MSEYVLNNESFRKVTIGNCSICKHNMDMTWTAKNITKNVCIVSDRRHIEPNEAVEYSCDLFVEKQK